MKEIGRGGSKKELIEKRKSNHATVLLAFFHLAYISYTITVHLVWSQSAVKHGIYGIYLSLFTVTSLK